MFAVPLDNAGFFLPVVLVIQPVASFVRVIGEGRAVHSSCLDVNFKWFR
jgi:hypothetical protein